MLQEDPEYRDRLIKVAQELNLDSEPAGLSVTELLRVILALSESDMGAFNKAAAIFYGQDMPHHINTSKIGDHFPRAVSIRETADLTGVDPALLAMVQLFEDSVRIGSPTEHGAFWWVYNLRLPSQEKSFGIAQIQVPTATDMLDEHREQFNDFSLIIDGMKDADDNWIHKEVARQLYENESFSIRVAGVYLMHLQIKIQKLLQNLDVAVADGSIDRPHPSGLLDRPYISSHELLMLAVGAYNQGMGILNSGLPERYRKHGPADVIRGVSNTVNIDYIHKVFSKTDEALE